MGNTPSQDDPEEGDTKQGYVLNKSKTGEIRMTEGFVKQLEEQMSGEDWNHSHPAVSKTISEVRAAAKEKGREEMKTELENEMSTLREELAEEKKTNSDLKETTFPIINEAAGLISAKLAPRIALNHTVCIDSYNRILDCYKENPNRTLYCSDQVRSFTHCVKSHRQKLVDPNK